MVQELNGRGRQRKSNKRERGADKKASLKGRLTVISKNLANYRLEGRLLRTCGIRAKAGKHVKYSRLEDMDISKRKTQKEGGKKKGKKDIDLFRGVDKNRTKKTSITYGGQHRLLTVAFAPRLGGSDKRVWQKGTDEENSYWYHGGEEKKPYIGRGRALVVEVIKKRGDSPSRCSH